MGKTQKAQQIYYNDMTLITKLVARRHLLQNLSLHDTQSLLLHSTLYKTRCYMALIRKPHCNTTSFTKSVATQHPLQNLLVHDTLKSPNETPGNIYRSPCPHLAIFYKIPKYFQKPQIFIWQHFTKKCNITLATFHQIPKTINFWANSYSIKAQILFGKNLYNN